MLACYPLISALSSFPPERNLDGSFVSVEDNVSVHVYQCVYLLEWIVGLVFMLANQRKWNEMVASIFHVGALAWREKEKSQFFVVGSKSCLFSAIRKQNAIIAEVDAF